MKYLLFILLLPTVSIAQKKRQRFYQEIYNAVIINNYGNKPRNILIADSTVNRSILNWNFTLFAQDYNRTGNILMGDMDLDSTWKLTFEQAEKRKPYLKNDKLKLISPGNIHAAFIFKDSMRWDFKRLPFKELKNKYGTTSGAELSDIILLKNKAIVEMATASGGFGLEDILYFLERHKGKWVVASYMPTWD